MEVSVRDGGGGGGLLTLCMPLHVRPPRVHRGGVRVRALTILRTFLHFFAERDYSSSTSYTRAFTRLSAQSKQHSPLL